MARTFSVSSTHNDVDDAAELYATEIAHHFLLGLATHFHPVDLSPFHFRHGKLSYHKRYSGASEMRLCRDEIR